MWSTGEEIHPIQSLDIINHKEITQRQPNLNIKIQRYKKQHQFIPLPLKQIFSSLSLLTETQVSCCQDV